MREGGREREEEREQKWRTEEREGKQRCGERGEEE